MRLVMSLTLTLAIGTAILEHRAWAQQSSPDQVRTPANVKPPERIKFVPPVYPQIARSARVQGSVVLELTITQSGKVQRATILRSIPLLDQAAIDAVMQWEYRPTRLNDVAVPIVMTTTVNFILDDRSPGGSGLPQSPGTADTPLNFFGVPANLMPTGAAVPFVRQAIAYLDADRFAEAEAAMGRALQLEPGNAACWYIMGTLQANERNQKRDLVLASAAMVRALEIGVPEPSFMSGWAREVIAKREATQIGAAPPTRTAPSAPSAPAPTSSSSADRQNPDPFDLRGTTWRCQGRNQDFSWTGYLYLHQNTSASVWETERSPRSYDLGTTWPNEVTSRGAPSVADLNRADPMLMRWATTRAGSVGSTSRELRVLYYFLSSIYVFRMRDGKLHGGPVHVSELDEQVWERQLSCFNGKGSCPDLFDFRVPASAVTETITCEQRPGWLR